LLHFEKANRRHLVGFARQVNRGHYQELSVQQFDTIVFTQNPSFVEFLELCNAEMVRRYCWHANSRTLHGGPPRSKPFRHVCRAFNTTPIRRYRLRDPDAHRSNLEHGSLPYFELEFSVAVNHLKIGTVRGANFFPWCQYGMVSLQSSQKLALRRLRGTAPQFDEDQR
jgi:hypothetical protein